MDTVDNVPFYRGIERGYGLLRSDWATPQCTHYLSYNGRYENMN